MTKRGPPDIRDLHPGWTNVDSRGRWLREDETQQRVRLVAVPFFVVIVGGWLAVAFAAFGGCGPLPHDNGCYAWGQGTNLAKQGGVSEQAPCDGSPQPALTAASSGTPSSASPLRWRAYGCVWGWDETASVACIVDGPCTGEICPR